MSIQPAHSQRHTVPVARPGPDRPVPAGIGFLVGGIVTSRTGFSPDASRVLTALLLSAVFLIATPVSLRRAAGR